MNIPEYVLKLDATDQLAPKRNEFVIPEGVIYMDGNSLGPLTRASKVALHDFIENQWGADLIQSWNKHQWIDLPSIVGEKIAALVGASVGQIICCDSVSVNLFKLLANALHLNPKRSVVLSQTDNFPTDLYIAEGLSNLLGANHCQLKTVEAHELIGALDENVAVLMLTHVNFRSGELHDIAELTRLAHSKGVLVIWDLAHSAGAVSLALDACEVDFAVGCGYKFLNGGPGAPSFVYVAHRHQAKSQQPLSGWMGHNSPFDFKQQYKPANGPQRFLSGTPSIVSMVLLNAALSVFDGISINSVYEKSAHLAEFFLAEYQQHDVLKTLQLISPRDPEQRGSQLAFVHPDAYAICQALIARGVVIDYREPNILRFGITPLYQSYAEIWQASQTLYEIMHSKEYKNSEYQTRNKVT